MDLKIRTQFTPNPNALKFVLNHDVKREGKVTFSDMDAATYVPMAHALMSLDGVAQVHFFENVITVTKEDEKAWEHLEGSVFQAIKNFISVHDPDFVLPTEKPVRDRSGLSLPLLQLEEILDRTIRPGLQADGGDVEVVDYQDHVITIRYEGACGGCPSSMYGTLEAIRSILKDEFDPQCEVVTTE